MVCTWKIRSLILRKSSLLWLIIEIIGVYIDLIIYFSRISFMGVYLDHMIKIYVKTWGGDKSSADLPYIISTYTTVLWLSGLRAKVRDLKFYYRNTVVKSFLFISNFIFRIGILFIFFFLIQNNNKTGNLTKDLHSSILPVVITYFPTGIFYRGITIRELWHLAVFK